MRGKHEYGNDTGEYDGITPAHAGKTSSAFACAFLVADHPPRMRGKHTTPAAQSPGPGITPAHAGKTPACQSSQAPPWDHPRACGENHGRQLDFDGEKGSPPRMRGKQRRVVLQYEDRGITPAHAGKTAADNRAGVWRRDHPRACGENRMSSSESARSSGSPPRMRGKLFGYLALREACGITPAHAGKTRKAVSYWIIRRDHPRACGENMSLTCSSVSLAGSPPRMRGKPVAFYDAIRYGGITPAHAGKT